MLTINCLFLSLFHDRNEAEKLKTSAQQRTKRGENFHKHAGAAILPTDAFKLQISAQKGASPCACKHSCTSSTRNVLKAFLDIRPCIVNKPGCRPCKLPIMG